ncbi:MAG: 2-oxoacid:acceptor oxidoreductase subunit alpha [Chloroflexi bacterium]|nr:2-oxoacid:acceptor oxidoreductase subunit alpha [Chloroflexota bacterium]
MKSRDFVVRFAGEGGQGVVTSAVALARAAAQVGYHVYTFATFPSQILGGPTWTQVRISTDPVPSQGDQLDILVAFNRYAYDHHAGELRKSGVVIYNSEDFTLGENGERSFGIAVDQIAKSVNNPRAANMVVIGAVAQLVEMPLRYLEDFVKKRFSRGRAEDTQVIESNILALGAGAASAMKSGFHLAQLEPPKPPQYEQILLRGNEAIALGAMAAGLNFYVGYPISPATTILVWMENNLVGKGRFVHQVSSEIEAISAIVGAGYAGGKSMTATAGPGFSLMSEGLGLAWMAEIPCVVVDVQRGGPATGLPTKTEQSDLQTVLHPAHGDVKLPVIAPGSVEECFDAAVKALNWAERYQGPVVILSEMALAERSQNIRKPDLASVKSERRSIYTGTNGYQRYDADELTPMPLPGGPGAYVANGSEHDGWGDTTHLPERHIRGTERRFGKLGLLDDGTFEAEDADLPVVIMPWGGSKGPAREAYETLRARGVNVGWVYTMYLHPMPAKLFRLLREKQLVIVPELNFQGQWSSVLRSDGIRAESIRQYSGLPFRADELAEKLMARIKQGQERKVHA